MGFKTELVVYCHPQIVVLLFKLVSCSQGCCFSFKAEFEAHIAVLCSILLSCYMGNKTRKNWYFIKLQF